ncbi:hypothetical protein CWE22_03730 [Pseudidiomarina aestuarii]|uniref:Receptor ligand binding region domain-containing protein n=1 Tax=Pseudidiomarina aestuarii TaxID=624146 RepID=A0A7Z6ZTZ4_9GAMM|nr:ABC transporter substrate-binding protein [Pseudidiomarina aestuarii]RUO41298.1 hypothetical protein CWE22_03730 [Pseudidiomarina aestuarii]
MKWRLFYAVLIGYLVFVAYRFYLESQPISAIEIRQNHLAQSEQLDVAVVWPEGEDKAGYVKAVRLVVEAINAERLGLCQSTEQEKLEPADNKACNTKVLRLLNYAEPIRRDAAVKQAKTIVRNPNMLAALGYYRSVAALPAAPVYEFEGVMMLSSGSTNAKLTDYDFNYIFRNVANDDTNAKVLAKHIHDEGYINAYVIYERDLYGTEFSNYFIEHASALGLRVPAQAFFEENHTNFGPLLSSLRSKISPINLTDEIALLQAKLQQAERMLEIARLSSSGDDASIIEFLAAEQKLKNGENKFFDSMPRTKLQQYLQTDLKQSSSTAYLESLFLKNQKELILLEKTEQYVELDQLNAELQMWIEKIKSIKDEDNSSVSARLINELHVTRKVIDLDADEVLLKFEQMQKRISKIKSGEVDVIFIAGFMPEVGVAIAQARDLDIKLPIFGGHPLIDIEDQCKTTADCADYGDIYALVTHDVNQYRRAYDAMKQGAEPQDVCFEGEENCLPARYACPNFETAYIKFREFAESYQQAYGTEPDNWAIQGYLAANIIQETLKIAYSLEPEVLADTLLYRANSEFADKGLMFSCHSHGITKGDILVEEMKIHKLEDL